jgi:hypothetical protein
MSAMPQETEARLLLRADTLARARRLATDWGYWCAYGQWGAKAGQRPLVTGVHGGLERRYKSPPQWHPPEPKFPEANELAGLAVQRAFVKLPQYPYRSTLIAEFYMRPWVIGMDEQELAAAVARKARVSIGAYPITLDRALLALANVMKRMGSWDEAL